MAPVMKSHELLRSVEALGKGVGQLRTAVRGVQEARQGYDSLESATGAQTGREPGREIRPKPVLGVAGVTLGPRPTVRIGRQGED